MALITTLSVGSTIAYFIQTEKSEGNVFTTGSIDLKVGNEASYNGMKCDNDTWTCESWADRVTVFEQGLRKDGAPVPVEASDTTKALGEAQFNETSNYVALGFGGEIVIKFDNLIINGPGSDIQVVETSPGDSSCDDYPEMVSIYASKTGEDGTWVYLGDPSGVKISDYVAINTAGVKLYPSLCLSGNLELGSLDWAKYLKFIDVSDRLSPRFAEDADGYDLDGVLALHCGAEPNLIGQSCSNSWQIADLGIQKFFDFSDIKPGDLGADVINLHLYNNEIWGRLVIDNVTDIDNGCVEPELAPVDADCPSTQSLGGVGELRSNLAFRIWLDEGSMLGFQGKDNDIGEGDGIWQSSEPELVAPAPIETDGETWNTWEWLTSSRTQHSAICEIEDADGDGNTNGGPCHGLARDGHLLKDTDYYLGMDWVLPITVGNAAQSDRFTFDMALQAVQQRNNPEKNF